MAEDDGTDRLYRDPELAQFYDLDNDWADDQETCRHLARGARSLLDLGCGTGLFLARLAEVPRRVGADPAAAMLDIARSRDGGDVVEWIETDARTLRLDEPFDLIVLTGHAFQVFLGDADRRAVLATIAHHLAPRGRFIFDSRNPVREAWRTWTPRDSRWSLQHPRHGTIEAWNDVACDSTTGIVTYETHYRVVATGKVFSAASKIAFPSQQSLAALIEEAGLVVEQWFGDWRGRDWHPEAPEIIPLGRLR